MAKHGEFSHIELPAGDVERAKSFYSNVFGWSAAVNDTEGNEIGLYKSKRDA